jgi:hypothetical protein
MDPRLDKSCVYQNDIVIVVLHISRYVYVHHLNLYIFFIILYGLSWNLVVFGWFGCDCWLDICIFNLSIFDIC